MSFTALSIEPYLIWYCTEINGLYFIVSYPVSRIESYHHELLICEQLIQRQFVGKREKLFDFVLNAKTKIINLAYT